MTDPPTAAADLCGHCGKQPVHAKSYCKRCYARWRRHGDPGAGQPGVMSPEDRFSAYAMEDGSGCWIWAGPVSTESEVPKRVSYGILVINKRHVFAHRWSYEHHVGPIPDGLEIDHLCRRPLCVNPEHLEAVTHKVNMERAWHGGTPPGMCDNGHVRTEENTGFRAASGKPFCKECTRISDRKRYYANAQRRFNRKR
jgi:hypothetical protein